MHQQQWLAMSEELGGAKALPIPNSFSQSQENEKFSYVFISPGILDVADTPAGRWTHGPSINGKGEFHVLKAEPYGDEPKLGLPVPEGHAQKEQMTVIDSIIGNIKDSLGM